MAGTHTRGRRPQPAAIRALKGAKTRPHHRSEAQFQQGIPAMPAFVKADQVAAERWQSLAPRIAQAGVLTEAHGEMLGLLCSTWADLCRAREQFADQGYKTVVFDARMTATGEMIETMRPNPLVIRIEKLAYQVARFLGEFGLTPMTSAKVAAKQATEEHDPFAEFASGNLYGTQ